MPSPTVVPVSVQTGAPEPQAKVPVWHLLVGVHAIPAVHARHTPTALHTMFVPHEAPGALLAPSIQTDEPVEHDVVPTLQGLGLVVHMRPGVHAVHVPALQKRFVVPHVDPSARFVPRSVHVAPPVAQDCVPLWHALAGVQVPPLEQGTQVPALQTIPVPQVVPAALFPLSTHTDEPVAQDVAPVLHTFVG